MNAAFAARLEPLECPVTPSFPDRFHFLAWARNNRAARFSGNTSPFGEKNIVYSDWTASGRLFEPIERNLLEKFGPYVGNTHTETSVTGSTMTIAFHHALKMIKDHVNADEDDVQEQT